MHNHTPTPIDTENSATYQDQQTTNKTEILNKTPQKKEQQPPRAITIKDPEHPFFYDFNVSYFQLTCSLKRILHIPLSPMFESEHQARGIGAEIKKTIPTLQIINPTFLFLSEHERNRQDVLRLIIPESADQRYKPEYLSYAIATVRSLITDPKHKPSKESLNELQELLQKLYRLTS